MAASKKRKRSGTKRTGVSSPPRSKIMDLVADLATADKIGTAAIEDDDNAQGLVGWMEGGARSYVRREVLETAPTCMEDAVAQLAAIYSLVEQTLDGPGGRPLAAPSFPSDDGQEYLLSAFRRLLYFVAGESKVDLKKTMLDVLAGYVYSIDDPEADAKRLARSDLRAPNEFKYT